MTENNYFKQAKASPEEVQGIIDFLITIEDLVADGDNDDSILELVYNDFPTKIEPNYQRILFGYQVLVENVCDPDLTYLEFKPEIKNLVEENQRLAKELETTKNELSRLINVIQIYQPPGSPPPGDSPILARWVLNTQKAIIEGLKDEILHLRHRAIAAETAHESANDLLVRAESKIDRLQRAQKAAYK